MPYYYKHGFSDYRHFWIARGDLGTTAGEYNAFNGFLDEVRISNGILTPEKFLRQRNDRGLLILYR